MVASARFQRLVNCGDKTVAFRQHSGGVIGPGGVVVLFSLNSVGQLVVHVNDACNDPSRFKGFQYDRFVGKEGLWESHVRPMSEIVVQDFQMMCFDVQITLCGHGRTELLNRLGQMQPPEGWDT